MPKKFANENPKVIAARDRKAAAKKDEQERKQKESEEREALLEALKRKEENVNCARLKWQTRRRQVWLVQTPRRCTRAILEERKEAELRLRKEEEERAKLAAEKIEVSCLVLAISSYVSTFAGRLSTISRKMSTSWKLGTATARTVAEAIQVLGGDREEIDKHPEKRMKAAYLAFDEAQLAAHQQEHPTYRLSQLKQLLKKEWLKSPENPLNAKLMALSAMVKVYHGKEFTTYSLDRLNSLTAKDVIREVTKSDSDRSVLSYTGRFLPSDTQMSSHNLRESDVLRILQGGGAPKLNQPCDDSLLRECDRLFDYLQKEESGYMHMRLMAEVVEPEFLSKIMKQFPDLRNDPLACHILHDYYIFKSMVTLPNDEEGLAKLRKFHSEHPALLPAINWLLKKHAQKGRGSTQRTPRVQADQSPAPAEPPQITQEMLRQAMAIAFGGAMPGGSGGSGSSASSRPASLVPTPPPAPAAAPAPEPNSGPSYEHILQLRSRFATQLVQLNEFGFTDEAANLSVLESTDGNVEVALDLLIAMREGQ
ncbi:UBA/TS-N domain protein [Cooperia oncophora]